jgi:hypothetical protein
MNVERMKKISIKIILTIPAIVIGVISMIVVWVEPFFKKMSEWALFKPVVNLWRK